ncbi:MAG TPA: hypothetical protein VK787_06655, partial [Puia sp.]|nr:hypothetical protein [Puia sp.]
TVRFNRTPNQDVVNALNDRFNQVSNFKMEILYDADAYRWLIIPFRFEKQYRLISDTSKSQIGKIFSKQISFVELPRVMDVGE